MPSEETSARNPSHLGSYDSPPGTAAGSGIAGTAFASIGAGISYTLSSCRGGVRGATGRWGISRANDTEYQLN
ncbi:hypothetical protein GCM10009806_13980 [Microbacterium flavum]